ncbi:MAG: chemotaxis response regulator protein-glutamate methylesterase [Hyphomicrobiales bacterium]|nr:chemotaxis response regulator protein-glutamate methylesterase [Hyphomicrobiales bacterium]
MSTATVAPPVAQSASDIRVAVVDDSAVVRGLVTRWIDEEPSLCTVGRYANGQLALDGIRASQPDVIVLDIEMPVMDGMTALPLLLKQQPGVKVIMASTLTRRNAEISLKALSLGAIDYIPKPENNRGVTTSSEFRVQLLRKIKAVAPKRGAATARAITPDGVAARPGIRPALGQPAPAPALRPISSVPPKILVIGSSTGGPQALQHMFDSIGPALTSIPVLVTQHMPATFTTILAEHIGRASGLPSKEGEDNEPLQPGHIYVAPGGFHMAVKKTATGSAIRIYDGPDVNFCKPAVDPLFESVAPIYGPATLAIVLTGMGSDGAVGGTRVADAGGTVIAQDEATSVVWGMPGATAAAGACAAILPLDGVGKKVVELVRGSRS